MLSSLADDLLARWSLSDHLGVVPSNLADDLLARCYLLGNLGTALSFLTDDWTGGTSQVYQSVASFYLTLPASDTVPTGCCWATAGLPIAGLGEGGTSEVWPHICVGGGLQVLRETLSK